MTHRAREIVRKLLKTRGVTVMQLVGLLEANSGAPISYNAAQTKISRGTFSADFLLEIFTVLGKNIIDLRQPAVERIPKEQAVLAMMTEGARVSSEFWPRSSYIHYNFASAQFEDHLGQSFDINTVREGLYLYRKADDNKGI